MKYKIFTIVLSGLLIGIYHTMANIYKPSSSTTGAPGETSCIKCHTGSSLNTSGKLMIEFDKVQSSYEPNKEYEMSVIVEKNAFNRFGFEVVAILQSTNKTIGEFLITDSSRTQIFSEMVDGEQRNYIGHTKIGTSTSTEGQNRWNFKWKSPQANAGNVVFYAASVAANANNTRFNDWVYTNNIIISDAINASEKPDKIESVAVWVNHESNILTIKFLTELPEPSTIQLTDVKGNLIIYLNNNIKTNKNNETIVSLPSYLSGIFFLNMEINRKLIVKKIVL